MCKLRINASCSVPLSLRVLKHPDSTQEASRKPPSFIALTSQGVVMPALPFANEPALSDHSYWSALTPRTSLIDIRGSLNLNHHHGRFSPGKAESRTGQCSRE